MLLVYKVCPADSRLTVNTVLPSLFARRARTGEISLNKFNTLELHFLKLLSFRLSVSPAEFARRADRLLRYADRRCRRLRPAVASNPAIPSIISTSAPFDRGSKRSATMRACMAHAESPVHRDSKAGSGRRSNLIRHGPCLAEEPSSGRRLGRDDSDALGERASRSYSIRKIINSEIST